MPKPKSLLLVLAGIIVVVAIGFAMTKPREPFYRGHSLSYWLGSTESVDNILAVHAIGTNAIPILLTWISYESPAWKRPLASLALKYNLEGLFNIMANPPNPAKALKAFSLLRTNLLPALPALVKLTNDTQHPQAAAQAATALCFLGPQALPCLADALSNTNVTRGRTLIVSTIWNLGRDGAPTNQCLPALLRATTDRDSRVRSLAMRAVHDLAPSLLTNTLEQRPSRSGERSLGKTSS